MIYLMINASAFDFILIIGKKKPILSVARRPLSDGWDSTRIDLFVPPETKGISTAFLYFFK